MSPTTAHTTLWIPRTLLLCTLLLSSACARFEKNIILPQSTLQTRLSNHFPVHKRKLHMTVELSNPEVQLASGSERVSVKMTSAVWMGIDFLGYNAIEVHGVPSYEPEGGSFHLTNTTIDYIETPLVSVRMKSLYRIIVSEIVTKYLRIFPFHTLQPSDAPRPLQEMRLKSAIIGDGAMELIIHELP